MIILTVLGFVFVTFTVAIALTIVGVYFITLVYGIRKIWNMNINHFSRTALIMLYTLFSLVANLIFVYQAMKELEKHVAARVKMYRFLHN